MRDCWVDPTALLAPDAAVATEQITKLTKCVEERVQHEVKKIENEIAFEAGLRISMGQDLTKYACLDEENATLTESLSNLSWSYKSPTTKLVKEYKIATLFDAFDVSSALLIEDFISPSQCEALGLHAQLDKTTPPLSESDNSPSFVTTYAIPGSAKSEMEVIEVMFQTQSYVKSTTDKNLSFRNKERLFTQYVLRASQRQVDATVCKNATSNVDNDVVATQEEGEAGICTPGDAALVHNSFQTNRIPTNGSGTVVLFCSSTGGAMRFPRTGVHIPASQVVGRALFLFHKSNVVDDDGTELGDVYMGEYALCQPQEPESTMNIFVLSYTL